MVHITIDLDNNDVARFYLGEECIAEVDHIMISPNVGEYVYLEGSKYYVNNISHDLHTGDVDYEVVEV